MQLVSFLDEQNWRHTGCEEVGVLLCQGKIRAESVLKGAPLSGIRVFLDSSNTGLRVISFHKMQCSGITAYFVCVGAGSAFGGL